VRILAIRGENLASLYGPFELPLDRGPIAEVGLFSISGPTGAGKSTLVDALCLALYGRTPRLGDRARAVLVGRPGDHPDLLLDANDERGILSRGAGAGWAEVDFEGGDGVRYRARWTVNRARGKAAGRFQPQKMVLTDLDRGAVITDRLSAVPDEVARRIGYTFEEFRRAVVLPQFEFTAFLEAKPDERAAILERVTGTDVYSRLSVAAHRRAAAEAEVLGALDDRAGRVIVLSDAERTALEDRLAAAQADRDAARARGLDAQEALRWHAEAERLEAERAGAAEALTAALARRDGAAADREELARTELVQPLRAVHGEAARTAAAEAEAAVRRDAAAHAVADVDAAHAEADAAHGRAAAAAEEAVRRQAGAQPLLIEARALDTVLGEAARRAEEAEAARGRAAGERDAAAAALADARRALAARDAERTGAEAWLAAHAAEAPLAAQWPRWRDALRDHDVLQRDLAAAEAAVASARAREAALGPRRAALAAEAARLDADAARTAAAAQEAARAAAEDDDDALRRRLAALADRRTALQGLHALSAEATRARAARDDARGEAARADEALAAASAERAALAARASAAEAAAGAAREALARIVEALGLAERRADLLPGAPCPLCGAVEHPYAEGGAPGEPLRRGQEQAVAAAEAELAGLRTGIERAAAGAASAGARRDRAHQAAEAAEAERAGAERRYGALRAATPDLDDVPRHADGAAEALAGALAATEGAQAEARREEEGAAQRRRAADAARAALEAARAARARADEACQVAEREAGEVAQALARGEDSRAALARRREGLEDDLEAPLGFRAGWREAARRQPRAFLAECAALAEAFAERVSARDAAQATRAALAARAEGAAARDDERRAQAGAAEATAAAAAAALAGARAARGALLSGAPADAVEQGLAAAERAARAGLEASRERLGAADRARAGARERAQATAETAQRAQAEAVAAGAALAEALARAGLDARALAALLTRDEGWVAAARERFASLDRAALAAEATLAERTLRVRRHRSERTQLALPLGPEAAGEAPVVPVLSREAAAGVAAEADAAERTAAEAVSEAELRLREDARNRTAHQGLARERAAQAAVAERWARLSGVIGSADGKAFRMFAQGLALDALLLQAGRWLAELAPRYALMRVPGTNLDLQVVDHDLGDEIRSVHGLSGGESFLVSLALALGLASLATHATHARTLFIDEGFGTLDRDTLEHAMAALDRLRASGRTVGVISHVPELHERIGVRVAVERVSAGRSRVVLPEGAAPPGARAAS
jgi:exonuclease SbcC